MAVTGPPDKEIEQRGIALFEGLFTALSRMSRPTQMTSLMSSNRSAIACVRSDSSPGFPTVDDELLLGGILKLCRRNMPFKRHAPGRFFESAKSVDPVGGHQFIYMAHSKERSLRGEVVLYRTRTL